MNREEMINRLVNRAIVEAGDKPHALRWYVREYYSHLDDHDLANEAHDAEVLK